MISRKSKYFGATGPEFSKIHLDKEIPYLIPPRFHMMIGLTGLRGSGKTTISSYLVEEFGFHFFSFRDLLVDIARKRGVDSSNRENLQSLGNTLREKHGKDILARLMIQKIAAANLSPNDKVVVSALRNPFEIVYLSRRANFFVIAVDMSSVIKRMQRKNDDFDGGVEGQREFDRLDSLDRGSIDSPCGQWITPCLDPTETIHTKNGQPLSLEGLIVRNGKAVPIKQWHFKIMNDSDKKHEVYRRVRDALDTFEATL